MDNSSVRPRGGPPEGTRGTEPSFPERRGRSVHIEIRGVERLSRRERQVVALKEMGLSNGAIARRLRIGAASVATLFQRAKAKGYEVVIVLPGDPLGLFDPGDGDSDDGDSDDGDSGEDDGGDEHLDDEV